MIHSQSKLMEKNDNILFEYQNVAIYRMHIDMPFTFNKPDKDGYYKYIDMQDINNYMGWKDYGISIEKSGNVFLTWYMTDDHKCVDNVKIATNKDLAREIEKKLDDILEDIKDIPDELEFNGTLDGHYDDFRFGNREISCCNIFHTTKKEMKRLEQMDGGGNEDISHEYLETIVFQNRVLDAYNEIARIFNSYDLGIRLRIVKSSHAGPGPIITPAQWKAHDERVYGKRGKITSIKTIGTKFMGMTGDGEVTVEYHNKRFTYNGKSDPEMDMKLEVMLDAIMKYASKENGLNPKNKYDPRNVIDMMKMLFGRTESIFYKTE